MSTPMLPVCLKRALVSVYDKTDLSSCAQSLAAYGCSIISTGNTATYLRKAGLEVVDVEALTGARELLGGRVKTLHPAIHAALLARAESEEDALDLSSLKAAPIDLVINNFYPFEKTAKSSDDWEELCAHIDIGGPAMLRAAAKNFRRVCVITENADFIELLRELERHDGATTLLFRKKMAAKAFARTAAYDAVIAALLRRSTGDDLPQRLVVAGEKIRDLRYGENPHQKAAIYADITAPGAQRLALAPPLQGKALSYNNYLDAQAGIGLQCDLGSALSTVCIIKHATPCGVACSRALEDAYDRALGADSVSAFGGVFVFNRPLEAAIARKISTRFVELVIAPSFSEEALSILAARKNLRLVQTDAMLSSGARDFTYRKLGTALLYQRCDDLMADQQRIVSKRSPTQEETNDLRQAWVVCKHVRSNAIVLYKDNQSQGIGAGQMSRVDAMKIALDKAQATTDKTGLVVASDAFFPFADSIEIAAAAGVRAIIQPGGSKRDAEVIDAVNAHDMAMIFTAVRHFMH